MNIPNTTEIIAYITAVSISFFRIKLNMSNEKVENVVNAPNKPTKMNDLIYTDRFDCSAIPHITPIINDPIRFTVKVGQGKLPITFFVMSTAT